MHECPYCGELIRSTVKCRFCGELIDPAARKQRHAAKVRAYQWRTVGVFVMLAALGLAFLVIHFCT